MDKIKSQEIKQMDQITHCLKRPSMYIGSIVHETHHEFLLDAKDDTKFTLQQREYVPGLMKLFNEVLDNSIDEYVRTNGKHANKISIKMTSTTFECTDNGRGIPNTKMTTLQGKEKYQAEVAFTEMLSGANYDNDDEATIGTNGLGSKAAAIFSKKTVIHNDDDKFRITITTKNNLSEVDVKETSSTGSGVHTKLWPDLKYFGLEELTDTDFNIIKERLLHLSISYPGITFKFNGKSLKLNDKKYFEMFNIQEFIKVNDNVSIGITHSPSDQFEHFSLVNGLLTRKGGSHINLIGNEIINPIRDKLVKKFKTIKPGDIRQKIRLVVIFKNFMNAKYTSQTKEELTNAERDIRAHLGKDGASVLDKFAKKVLKNDDIMLPITELFLLKEQAKQNAELKKLDKKGKKKPKSEKFMPPIGKWTNCFVCEGDCLHEDTKIIISDGTSVSLKDVTVGEYVFTGDGTVQKIKSKVKSIRETIQIKTKSGIIKCSPKHRFYVYDNSTNTFRFVNAKELLNNQYKYKMIKSKIHNKTLYYEVCSNNITKKVIVLDAGEITYTNNDYFVVFSNNFSLVRKHATSVEIGDMIILE